VKQRSNTPLLLAIVAEAMGYGAIFGLLADLQDKFGFQDVGLGLIAASAFPPRWSDSSGSPATPTAGTPAGSCGSASPPRRPA
jgi:hypothetical protein